MTSFQKRGLEKSSPQMRSSTRRNGFRWPQPTAAHAIEEKELELRDARRKAKAAKEMNEIKDQLERVALADDDQQKLSENELSKNDCPENVDFVQQMSGQLCPATTTRDNMSGKRSGQRKSSIG